MILAHMVSNHRLNVSFNISVAIQVCAKDRGLATVKTLHLMAAVSHFLSKELVPVHRSAWDDNHFSLPL
jgi:hypothetical protein